MTKHATILGTALLSLVLIAGADVRRNARPISNRAAQLSAMSVVVRTTPVMLVLQRLQAAPCSPVL